jgi:hypothetical protein
MGRPAAQPAEDELIEKRDIFHHPVAAAVDENVGCVPGFLEPGAEECHGDARHPQPRHQHHVARHSLFPALAKIALARAMRRPAATR